METKPVLEERKKERARLFPMNTLVAFVYLFLILLLLDSGEPSWKNFFNAVLALLFGPFLIGAISTAIMELNIQRIDEHLGKSPWVKRIILLVLVVVCAAIVNFV